MPADGWNMAEQPANTNTINVRRDTFLLASTTINALMKQRGLTEKEILADFERTRRIKRAQQAR
jgi:hypothetical protein